MNLKNHSSYFLGKGLLGGKSDRTNIGDSAVVIGIKGGSSARRPWRCAVLVSPSGTLEKSPYLGLVYRNVRIHR